MTNAEALARILAFARQIEVEKPDYALGETYVYAFGRAQGRAHVIVSLCHFLQADAPYKEQALIDSLTDASNALGNAPSTEGAHYD